MGLPSVDFSSDSRTIGLAYQSGHVFVWDLQAASHIQQHGSFTRNDLKDLIDKQCAFSTYVPKGVRHFSFKKSFSDLCFVVGSQTSAHSPTMMLRFFEGPRFAPNETNMGPVSSLAPYFILRNSKASFLTDLLYDSLDSRSDREFIRHLLNPCRRCFYYMDFFDEPNLIMMAFRGDDGKRGYRSELV
ncbi:MAG: hypothetical protein IPP67_03665, partial [Rhodospirillaceae bacterium]|nr:hypothetical protein [Rhodospirillaceae bacterium]